MADIKNPWAGLPSRDPRRIPYLLLRLEAAWEKYPDLRLGQLILNVIDKDSLYHMECEQIVSAIEDFYRNLTSGGLKM